MAPVNAPRSWPKSSDSRRPLGMAAQLILTKVRSWRGLRLWMARAKSSLPVPVSPRRRTVVPKGADDFRVVTVEFGAPRDQGLAGGDRATRWRGVARDQRLRLEDVLVAGEIEGVNLEQS